MTSENESTVRNRAGPSGMDETDPRAEKTLNFRVPEEFHREFKIFAASHGMSMVALLMEGFRLMKQRNETNEKNTEIVKSLIEEFVYLRDHFYYVVV